MSTHFLEVIPPNDWRERAACRGYDPELWFPNGKTYATVDTAEAVRICTTECEVRQKCLNFALDNGIDHGIYGGKTPDERKAIARRARRWRLRRKGKS